MSAKEQLIAPTIFVGSVVVGYKMYGKQSINSIHLYAASMWFGLTTWTSCIAGFIMYRTLPLSQFAKLQQRMFPVYYAVINGCTVLCLLSVFNSKYESQKKILGSSLLCSLFHLSLISPRTNKYLDTYMTLRDKEGDDSESTDFKKAKKNFHIWHGISNLCNLYQYGCITVHMYWLSMNTRKGMKMDD